MSGTAKVVDDELDDGSGGGGGATAGNQTTEIARLDSILAKIIAAPSTEAKQDTGNTSLGNIDGKLPAVAAGADAVANPTLSKVFAYLQSFNGASWDRTKQVLANVASDAITDWAVTAPVVGAANVAWDAATSKWRRLLTDANGALKSRLFDSAGAAQFPDAAAPADAGTNAENSPSIRSRIMSFNGATWDRIRSGLTGVQTAFTGFQNQLPMAVYRLVRNTSADGNAQELQATADGSLSIQERARLGGEDNANDTMGFSHKLLAASTYAASVLTTDFGATVTKNAKASAGVVTGLFGTNRNAATRYLQLHNTATTPAGGAVPVLSIPVAAGSSVMIGNDVLSLNGIAFATGIAYAWSTTVGTYTAATAADQDTSVIGK